MRFDTDTATASSFFRVLACAKHWGGLFEMGNRAKNRPWFVVIDNLRRVGSYSVYVCEQLNFMAATCQYQVVSTTSGRCCQTDITCEQTAALQLEQLASSCWAR